MGAYLQKPLTDKESTDELNDLLTCGASSMQGWRSSQEDAHNSILTYDGDTSFFSVFDGHGGSEVAIYCSKYLPQVLKDTENYKKGKIGEALIEAFLKIDSDLLKEEVIEELKKLAMAEEENCDETDKGEEDEEDLAKLCEEGQMPLYEVLKKYKGNKNAATAEELSAEAENLTKPGGSKQSAAGPGVSSSSSSSSSSAAASSVNISSSSSSVAQKSSPAKSKKQSDADSTITSSDQNNEVLGKSSKGKGDAAQCSSPDSSSVKTAKQGADAEKPESSTDICEKSTSSINPTEPTVNGDLPVGSSSQQQDNEISTNSAPVESVSSSSTTQAPSESPAESSDSVPNGCVSHSAAAATATVTTSSISMPQITSPKEESDLTRYPKRVGADLISGLGGGYPSDSEEDEDDEDEDEAMIDAMDSDDEEEDDLMEDESDDDLEDEESDDAMDEESTAFIDNIIEEPGKDSGCTAVVAVLKGNELYVANAGDSRCVVCRDGKAIEMSFDHKPEDKLERNRIMKAGGNVTMDGRVNGGLNLSRAIGDHAYKMNLKLSPEEQMISALPDVKKLKLSSKDEFMILACDGIWNSLTSEKVVEYIKEKLENGTERISEICEFLFDTCLAPDTYGDGTGCDNMTAVIVKFKQNFTSTLGEPETEEGKVEVEEIVVATNKKRPATDSTDGEEVAPKDSEENPVKRAKTDADSSPSVPVPVAAAVPAASEENNAATTS